MVIVQKTYDTSTLAGQLECVADMFAMPADNLALSLRGHVQQVLKLNLSLIAEASKKETTEERRAELLIKMQFANRGLQMILEALALLEGTKSLSDQLAPKPQPEIAPADLPTGPPLRRQTGTGGS